MYLKNKMRTYKVQDEFVIKTKLEFEKNLVHNADRNNRYGKETETQYLRSQKSTSRSDVV